MDLRFNISLAEGYKSKSQITKVLTEDWFARNMFCPICGELTIHKAEPNAPVKDFVCEKCKAQYELKSKQSNSDIFQTNVIDGEYKTMINHIIRKPQFFLYALRQLRS